MRNYLLLPAFLLLMACQTTVIDEAEREFPLATEVPVPAPVVAEDISRMADLSQSFVAFVGKAPGLEHEGRFRTFEFVMDTKEGVPAFVRGDIEIGSMETDIQKLTDHLLSEDFFDEPIYPEASFMSSRIVSLGEDRYEIIGQLTIKDQTHEVTMPALITEQFLTATYDLDRLQFGVGEAGKVDQYIPVEIKIVFAP